MLTTTKQLYTLGGGEDQFPLAQPPSAAAGAAGEVVELPSVVGFLIKGD
jgi:hypothetical protein